MSAPEHDNLEQRLQQLGRSSPSMPTDVEQRLRARLAQAPPPAFARPGRPRPPFSSGSGGMSLSLILLVAIVATTAWVVTHSVLPVLRGETIGGQVDNCAVSTHPSASAAPPNDPHAAAALAGRAAILRYQLPHAGGLMPSASASCPSLHATPHPMSDR